SARTSWLLVASAGRRAPGESAVNPVAFQEQPKLPQPKEAQEGLKPPRMPVFVEPLPALGGVIIRTQNKDDMEAVLALLKYISERAKLYEITVDIVELKQADATNVAFQLANMYAHVIVGPTGTFLVPGAAVPQQKAGGFGGGFGGGGLGGGQLGGAAQAAALPTNPSVYLQPLPRINSILIAAAKSRLEEIRKDIEKFDQPPAPTMRARE